MQQKDTAFFFKQQQLQNKRIEKESIHLKVFVWLQSRLKHCGSSKGGYLNSLFLEYYGHASGRKGLNLKMIAQLSTYLWTTHSLYLIHSVDKVNDVVFMTLLHQNLLSNSVCVF